MDDARPRTGGNAASQPGSPKPSAPSPSPASPPRPASTAGPPGKLTLIGAGHVFQIENAIREAIVMMRPDVVFIELDKGRLQALIAKRQGKAPEPRGGFIHKKLAKFQEGVAGMYGADVGGEMLGALAGAQAVGARLVMVDDPAEETLRRALKELTWRERLRFVGMLIGGAAKSVLPSRRRNAKEQVENEIRRYQEDPTALLGPGGELATKFPTIHRIVIAERDTKMSARIRRALAGAQHGVAVLGDGHLNGMIPLLSDLQPSIYRLADVRAGRLPRLVPLATGTTESVGFSMNTRSAAGSEFP